MSLATKPTFCFIAAVLISAPQAESATIRNFKDGNALLSECATNRATCAGYIIGSIDQMAVSDALHVDEKPSSCQPENVTLGQDVAVVLNYMNDHPEELHQPAAILVHNAMNAAFKCAK